MDNPNLVGRHTQRRLFQEIHESNQPAFIAIYGRRRIGKTYLVREGLKDTLRFELTGTQNGTLSSQLENFADTFAQATGQEPATTPPASWQEAFRQLAAWCDTLPQTEKHVLFFDELPWLAGPRSKFLQALDYFWNAWGSKQSNVILVVCGSSASWMIKKLLHHKGGLHNRVTHRIRLTPFDLAETDEFLKNRNITLEKTQIAELYMVFGGVPLYLEQMRRGESAAQTIDRTCFASEGLLHDEFSKLYPALFDSPERHMAIVRALAEKNSGLTRGAIAANTGQSPSGRLTSILQELEESGFIESTPPFGKRVKDTLYRLSDEYSLFYFRWIERSRSDRKGDWIRARTAPRWQAWSGYAFESLCLKHIAQIKAALGIAGVVTDASSWHYRPSQKDASGETGAQIDLLIDRADACINLCEMKFSDSEFVIDKRYAARLRERRETFRRVSKTRKNLFLTMVTTHGVRTNPHALEVMDASITLDALFQKAASPL